MFLARVAPHANTSAEYWAFLCDNTFLNLPSPLFFSLPSTITSSTPCSLMGRWKEGGGKANLLTLNRRGGVAARIKLRGWVPTAKRRRRYRRNDYFPRTANERFRRSPIFRPVPVRTFYMRDWSTVNAEKPGVLYVSRTARNRSVVSRIMLSRRYGTRSGIPRRIAHPRKRPPSRVMRSLNFPMWYHCAVSKHSAH